MLNPTLTPAELDATRSGFSGRRYSATTDSGASFEVFGLQGGALYARGYRTGALVRVVPTGVRVTRGQVRARFEFATDLNGADGAVGFGAETTGGVLPVAALEG